MYSIERWYAEYLILLTYQSVFSYVSKAGVPSKPGIPKVLEGSKDSIQWEKAEDNGSRLMYYILEIRYVSLQKCFVNYKELSSSL